MNELNFPFIEVAGSSTTSLAEAISNALTTIRQSVDQPLWVEKVSTRAVMAKDQLVSWQVVLRIGFTEEPAKRAGTDLSVDSRGIPPGTH